MVKLTHWSIVAAVLANALGTEEGSGAHVWVGYTLAAVLALRLLWGLVGPAEARFTAFVPSPRRALAHVRDIRSGRVEVHASHNPLGALMVYAIWVTLGVIIATGVAMAGPLPASDLGLGGREIVAQVRLGQERGNRDGQGDDEGADGELRGLGEVHEAAVDGLYVLILLHIAGVTFETRRSGREILLAMLPAGR